MCQIFRHRYYPKSRALRRHFSAEWGDISLDAAPQKFRAYHRRRFNACVASTS